ncbi:MAG: hypothetical protein IT159_09150 [Bryobacterales bacterium]|nr:hypothetical protein [Bryobacterales bacterium]
MTYETEERYEEMPVITTSSKPPPLTAERLADSRLFQGLDELRAERGLRPGTMDIVYLVGGGLLLGAAVFGLLYLGLLFLE